MFFRSERLFLRPGWPEDWSDLFRRIDDERIKRNLADAPWPYRAEDARDFAGEPQDPLYPHFLITLPSMAGAGETGTTGGSELIGCIGIAETARGPHLGYWISPERWGHGYATEAGRAVLSIARTLGHRRIVAGNHLDNPASARVLRKLGFRQTGMTEPHPSATGGQSAAAQMLELILQAPAGDDDHSGGSAGGHKVTIPRAA